MPTKEEKVQLAKQMRALPTKSERVMWGFLRARRAGGFKFRRQAIKLGWILDFYCPAAKLAIEIDGSSHAFREVTDRVRDESLKKRFIQVIRFSNEQVLNNPDAVVKQIIAAAMART